MTPGRPVDHARRHCPCDAGLRRILFPHVTFCLCTVYAADNTKKTQMNHVQLFTCFFIVQLKIKTIINGNSHVYFFIMTILWLGTRAKHNKLSMTHPPLRFPVLATLTGFRATRPFPLSRGGDCPLCRMVGRGGSGWRGTRELAEIL